MCFPGGDAHNSRVMCLRGGGTQIIRDMCFPGVGTQITVDMCFPGGRHGIFFQMNNKAANEFGFCRV